MMDMHGMFFQFPKTFSAKNSAGILPIASHLRYVPDFCDWNGKLVLATDETSIQENPLAGQPQTNLWIGDYNELKSWGPVSAYGGPWIQDQVAANTPSDPFLIDGFDRRLLHLAVGRINEPSQEVFYRATGTQKITSIPEQLTRLPRVTIARGDWHRPAPGYKFEVAEPVIVYLALDRRGEPKLGPEWTKTELTLTWMDTHEDAVYSKKFPAGTVEIPGNDVEHAPGSFGMPHMAFVEATSVDAIKTKDNQVVTVTVPKLLSVVRKDQAKSVDFQLQVDPSGDGNWTDLSKLTVPANGYVNYFLPKDLDAVWLRLSTDKDCIATAYLHQTTSRFIDGSAPENQRLFAGLANVDDPTALGARVYAAKRDRNLRVITSDRRFLDFTKTGFEFKKVEEDQSLEKLLKTEPEFTVDNASVILNHGGMKLRLPKGDAAYDKPFVGGWPRTTREVESERHLANIHGTFYEVPLVSNGAPPAFNLMRPIASHSKQITDYCSWNGLLVLAGVRPDAKNDGHVFADPEQKTSLWFGGIDDLWRLGKPVGHGGPWFDERVKKGVPSDPFLITGYDEKTVELSHKSDETVSMTLQIDLNATGLWVNYHVFQVEPGEKVTHRFPEGFSAFWVRFVSSHDTTATAQFTYR
jgi:hypothetical protein